MSIAQKTVLKQLGSKATTTVWPAQSKDPYGKVTFGAPFTVSAELKVKDGITRGAAGQDISYTLSFYTEKTTTTEVIVSGFRIKNGDHLAIADPIEAGAFSVLTVEEMTPILPTENNDLIIRC